MSDKVVNEKPVARAWAVRARLIQRAKDPVTDQLPNDPLTGSFGPGGIMLWPINPVYQASLLKCSPTLKPCIDTMAQNVDGFGYELDDRPGMVPTSDAEAKEKAAERERLTDILDSIHPDMSLTELRKRRRTDIETTGRGGLEILDREPVKGEKGRQFVSFEHIPARVLRFCSEDAEPTKAEAPFFDRKNRKWITKTYYKRFRRFAQVVDGRPRYFSEFGDPRLLDRQSGRYFTRKDGAGNDYLVKDRAELTKEEQERVANQVWVGVIYDPEQSQGMARWEGSRIGIESSYRAQESVWDYVDNNGIPKAMICVSGGTMFEDTVQGIRDLLDNSKGKHAENRVVVLDVVTKEMAATQAGGLPTESAPATSAKPMIEVIRLGDLQRADDAMFLKYTERSSLDTRAAFRFGAIFLGQNQDATYATANVLLQLAEMQVFGPERQEFDWVMNHRIFPWLQARWHVFRSLGPTLEDNATWIEAVKLGLEWGLIPDFKTARAILSEVLGYSLTPEVKEGEEAPPYEAEPPAKARLDWQASASPSQFGFGEDVPRTRTGSGVSVDRAASLLARVILRAREKVSSASQPGAIEGRAGHA